MDAAIAANAVLGVVEPMSCGIGGDLFAIVWDAKTKRLYGLNASGRSPASRLDGFFQGQGTEGNPDLRAPELVGPGMRRRLGPASQALRQQAWPELLAPAIDYAETGFPVSEIIAAGWRASERSLQAIPHLGRLLPSRRPCARKGRRVSQPGPRRSLRTIAKDGRDAFYRGPLAEAIVKYSQSVGGLFSLSDFAEHTSNFLDPVSTNYRGFDVWELPPNGQGIAVLQMLNLLEPYDLKSMGPQSAEALHLMIEAKKLAYEDRAKFYADPDFARLPIATLISKPYAARRGRELNPERANPAPVPGEPDAGRHNLHDRR